jgi:hypothetical protein
MPNVTATEAVRFMLADIGVNKEDVINVRIQPGLMTVNVRAKDQDGINLLRTGETWSSDTILTTPIYFSLGKI